MAVAGRSGVAQTFTGTTSEVIWSLGQHGPAPLAWYFTAGTQAVTITVGGVSPSVIESFTIAAGDTHTWVDTARAAYSISAAPTVSGGVLTWRVLAS